MKKIDGKNSHDWFEQGAKEKDPPKKVKYFRNTVKLKPEFVGGWTVLGNAYADMGDYEKAMECYNHALSICPRYREAKYNKKNLEKKMGEAALKTGT
nr:tetratricopeptide repeat protein [Methanosarcina sp. DH2]